MKMENGPNDIQEYEPGEFEEIEQVEADDDLAEEHDQFNSDAEADADALAGIGWRTDEDYGDYGGDRY